MKKALKGTKGYKQVRKAEQLYIKAAQAAGNTKLLKHIYDKQDEEEQKALEGLLSNENTEGEENTSSETVDKTEEISYSKKGGYTQRNPSTVTQKEFNHHYWAKANNIVSDEELAQFTNSIGALKRGDHYDQCPNPNADGFYMIPVGKNGIKNKIIFTDGKYENPSIEYVATISSNNETELNYIRSELYDYEFRGIPYKVENIVRYDYAKDFRYSQFQERLRTGNFEQNKRKDFRGQDGNGDFGVPRYAVKGETSPDTDIDLDKVDLVTELPKTDIEYRRALSYGQLMKKLANHMKMKVYSKKETEGIYNDIMDELMTFGDKYGVLKGKKKEEVMSMLWEGLNLASLLIKLVKNRKIAAKPTII